MCFFCRSNIFFVAFLFRDTLHQCYRYVLKEKNVQRAYHLYYFLLMLQDIFLFELNFKKEKIKCGLHLLFRPEIAENQLVGGRQITKQSKGMPSHGNCKDKETKKLLYFLNFAIFCIISLLCKTCSNTIFSI